MEDSTAANGGRRPRPWRALPRNVKLLGVVSFFNDVASEMIFPLLPQFILNVLGGDKFRLGIIEGVAESGSSLLKLFAGGLSDRLRARKPLVVAGYVAACVARPLTGLAGSVWQAAACRWVDRAGKGVRTAPRDALIADSTPHERRGTAFGFHRAMDHLGAATGPLLAAAFLLAFPGELRFLFLLTVIPGAVVAALVLFGLKETPPAGEAPRPARIRFSLAGFDRSFTYYLAALVLFTLGNASDAFLLVRAGELGVPVWALPLLWCAFGLAKSAGNLFAGRQADLVSPKSLIFFGWIVYAAVYLAFGLATSAWHAWALFLAYAVFYALTEPAEKKLVAGLSRPDNRGLAFGWFNLAIGATALPSSLLFGWLYERCGALAAFGLGAALALAAAGLLALVRAPEETRGE